MSKKDQEVKIKYSWRSDSNPFSDSENAVWQPYDDEDIIAIEEGYQKYLSNNAFEEINLKKASNYKVNFSTWMQSCLSDLTRIRIFKREISKEEQKTENPKFFWRSDKDPFSPIENAEWTPYDSETSKFLESSYQKYRDGQGPNVVKLGDKYNIDFQFMMQISIADIKRQRPIKKENPSKPKTTKTNKIYYCSNNNCKSKKLFYNDSLCLEHPSLRLEIPEYLVNLFDFKCKLGSGSFGFVFQVYDYEDQEVKALKLVKLDNFKDGDVIVLKKLSHPNIIRYFRSKAFAKDLGFLLMEFCESDLHSLIKEKKLNFKDKLKIFKQICKGIKYCHKVKQIPFKFNYPFN